MENKEFYIDTVIRSEKQRCTETKAEYERALEGYPRGTLVLRERNGHKYCYFRYRDGKKIVTKYAGTGDKLDGLKASVAERDALIERIRSLGAELERIERLEATK